MKRRHCVAFIWMVSLFHLQLLADCRRWPAKSHPATKDSLSQADVLVVEKRWSHETYTCSRRHSQLSCILGCLRCVETYSRRVYRIGGCCRECQVTQAVLVDSGPDLCSVRFIDFDYLKILAHG